MTSAENVYEDLRATVRERVLRERGITEVDDLELRRTLNELAAELRAGQDFEQALALAARSPEGLGPEDAPAIAAAPISPPRRALVSAVETDEERHARQRALFEERQRRAAAVRPMPKPMPPKAPIPVAQVDVEELALEEAGLAPELGDRLPERRLGARKLRKVLTHDAIREARALARERAKVWYADPAVVAFDERVIAVLRERPLTAYDLAWKLEDAPHDVGVSLLRLKARGRVEVIGGRGRTSHWRVLA